VVLDQISKSNYEVTLVNQHASVCIKATWALLTGMPTPDLNLFFRGRGMITCRPILHLYISSIHMIQLYIPQASVFDDYWPLL
jgi:hypothetical protein